MRHAQRRARRLGGTTGSEGDSYREEEEELTFPLLDIGWSLEERDEGRRVVEIQSHQRSPRRREGGRGFVFLLIRSREEKI